MEITWLGRSCFQIRGGNTRIITDPYPPELGYSQGNQTADIITVSHQHPGHSYTQAIGGEPKEVARPGEYEIGDALIIGFPSFHDAEQGKKRGKNTIFLFELDDITICHLGDLGHALTASQVGELEPVDILLLPVGGVSTINSAAAAAIVRQIEPKVVMPMHYQTGLLDLRLDTVDGFLTEMGIKHLEPIPKASFTKSTLPLVTQVVLLSY